MPRGAPLRVPDPREGGTFAKPRQGPQKPAFEQVQLVFRKKSRERLKPSPAFPGETVFPGKRRPPRLAVRSHLNRENTPAKLHQATSDRRRELLSLVPCLVPRWKLPWEIRWLQVTAR